MEDLLKDILELFPKKKGSEKLYFQSGIIVKNEENQKVSRTNNTGFLCNAFNVLKDTLREAKYLLLDKKIPHLLQRNPKVSSHHLSLH